MANYTVIGLGGSGLSAVNFLVNQGHTVAVTDGNFPPLADKLPSGVATYFGGINADILLASDKVLISPGVDPTTPAIFQAIEQGVSVVSDVQVFIENLKKRDTQNGTHTPIVAITGSNAKSTVTTLVGLMAEKSGKTVGVGGNIGTPALDLLKIDGMDMAVLELSSFQLEMMSEFGADVATILNLSADHLDRHGDMAGYLAQKLRIFDNAKNAVVWLDDKELARACIAHLPKHAQMISTSGEIGEGFSADFCLKGETDEHGETIWLCHNGEKLISSDEILIKGKHNLLNALSALALGSAVGLDMNAMLDVLRTFMGLPHRCEYVADVGGKVYFNDSKGTNIGATLSAIDGLGAVYGEQSLALILGGQGKGQDFAELIPFAEQFADSIYLIGQDADLIQKTLANSPILASKMTQAGTLEKAVKLASQSSAKVVLLSPACASLDQFKSYNERGEWFVGYVKALA
ncbi:UDP-N-acetylmuramoyl-L-alanine--D-glutamate ligase [Moraxella bovis]|uniref:UDP-N-acetylmuramoyl-L-alanine--D-glutamate ligase n=1 Tax=Moraxella bovis TaxID=476 RepID=UPI002226631F|nr:UDP-N-acetylmuramoyl-L-alanine--D-glutamate ligase [Moraxella bovis]UYZ68156.1 UDP-N-acetylmuramoyl-L-alanine--D-glutamate ligase [Moraxella bovis]UYZ70538.1 UDP-N-acetylmuramoyl-L-alanine--D-glutamate ligase [Moraxella bovis]UYZ73542.1 UDP-N-acetylmuramoyl-L-alanine--D-glutamate ligase [Moraxella bovis]UZA13840.1 UDP-N-acetylmuramoyl-L-alanine--D-glutamate ligase [Moraxella bovis]UZA27808.1 UDP-N-acetylmuramoyl-L-alanine--D-glutamate ligase [Moraxella bovis]